MEVSVVAKQRFCKDCNIPLRIFQEPYFSDRIKLYDKFYGTNEKWNLFVSELEKYHCEQDYFEEYNRIKDSAILSIKESSSYKRFNEEDMNKYRITHIDLPSKDIFKSSNNGKCFISIDMRKANFSALQNYSSEIFGNADTWEEFIGRYTQNQHIINSKYIRQVILGNCNPKRHITYEKYIMDQLLIHLKEVISIDRVVFFSNDEIVIDVSDREDGLNYLLVSWIKKNINNMIYGNDCLIPVPFRVELFRLYVIHGTEGFYKEIIKENGEKDIEFKCLDNYMLPFVIRRFLKEDITENDKVFYHEGLLAQFIEIPEIEEDITEY